MPNALRVPYSIVLSSQGEPVQRPILSLTLGEKRSISVAGLIDSGADVSVLPYPVGLELGLEWNAADPALRLSGNLAAFDTRGVIVSAQVGDFAPVRLGFAWTRAQNIPLILGQVNFFLKFDVCFFRSEGLFEIQARS